MDLPHQTLLRLACESQSHEWIEAFVQEYWRHPSVRDSTYQSLNKRFQQHAPQWSGGRRLMYSNTASEHLQQFRQELEVVEQAPTVQCANDYGFAAFFERPARIEADGADVEVLASSRHVSVGAMNWYSFGTDAASGCSNYIQEFPVRVLAESWRALLAGVPPETEENWTLPIMQRELQGFATLDSKDALQQAFMAALALHESGHQLDEHVDTQWIAALHAPVEDLERWSVTTFPTAWQRKSWQRIQEGRASKADLAYLYGDLISNMIAIERGLAGLPLATMRALHWWLVPAEGPDSLPRGCCAFLLSAGADWSSRLLAHLETVFSIVSTSPHRVADVMLDFERATWRALRELDERAHVHHRTSAEPVGTQTGPGSGAPLVARAAHDPGEATTNPEQADQVHRSDEFRT